MLKDLAHEDERALMWIRPFVPGVAKLDPIIVETCGRPFSNEYGCFVEAQLSTEAPDGHPVFI